MLRRSIVAIFALIAGLAGPSVQAADVEGCTDHPAVSRYPGTELLWCVVENCMEYKVPVGPVTGYRRIGEWEETEGRVTRNFYLYSGTDRTHGEIYKNYLDAFEAGGFTILASGLVTERNVKGESVGDPGRTSSTERTRGRRAEPSAGSFQEPPRAVGLALSSQER